MRAAPVLAIAWRDLRSELKGRAGLGLPIISLALLLPIALIGSAPDGLETLAVRGDVPPEVLAVPKVEQSTFGTGFRQVDGVTLVFDYRIPPPIREALDAGRPAVVVEELHPPTRIPGRTLLLALVSASTLTGAVSGSIGGERARHTLQALLSAAVTRLEVVLGKWLAWSAFGTVGALVASLAAVVSGRASAGAWLLAMPVVPALTVALGLWLVRRTTDIVAGTSVSLRVMPAVLGGAGLLSWVLATFTDVGAAVVPLGGALMVAGDLWPGQPGITALALGSSVLTTAALLVGTARDLDEHPPRVIGHRVRPSTAIPDGLLTGALWYALVPGPVLWGWAGNPAMTEILVPGRGLLAGSLMLMVLFGMGVLRNLDPLAIPRIGRPDWTVVPAGLLIAAAAWLPGFSSLNPWVVLAGERMSLGLVPVGFVGVVVVLAQELWFRGWMQGRAGPVASTIAWVVCIAPFAPFQGLVTGIVLAWVASRSGLSGAISARVLGVLVAGAFLL